MDQFLNYESGYVSICTYRQQATKSTTFDDCKKAIINRTEEDLNALIPEDRSPEAEELVLLGKDEYGWDRNYSCEYPEKTKLKFDSSGESQVLTVPDEHREQTCEVFFRKYDNKIVLGCADEFSPVFSKINENLEFDSIEEAEEFLNELINGTWDPCCIVEQ